ncbi:hypothetical protein BDW66DRAFT_139880 [Aspergillus desertorum]
MASAQKNSLQDSLQSLNATTWDAIPSDQSSLRKYITDLHAKARLIIDSVPEPPPFETKSTLNNIKLKPSPARLGTTNESTLANQKQWSKPIVKPIPNKDNPLGIPVYKIPGTDGQGHWFGRRSVHRGLSYCVWEEKLSSEMAETLRTNRERIEKGQAPDQAVRGIGAQRALETIEVKDENGEKLVGKVNVYHVSASFPRPTTSRDFVVMIVTWDEGFVESERADGNEIRREGREGRSWMMVSKPIEHPDAPEGEEYIRGQYESVEMIREILMDKDGSDADAESEPNPVEWTMVTRSDPGGSIPRWMVEKGTPKSICTDAAKFLEWASQDSESSSKTREQAQSPAGSKASPVYGTAAGAVVGDLSDTDSSLEFEYEQEEHHGLIASVSHLLNAGLERYAPQAVLDYIPAHSRQSSSSHTMPHSKPRGISEHTPEHQQTKDSDAHDQDAHDQDDALSQASITSSIPAEATTPSDKIDVSAAEILQRSRKGKLSSHERQLAKLAQEKRSVEAQIQLVRSDIHTLGLRAPDEQEVKKETTSARVSVDNPGSTTSPRSSTNKLTSDGTSSSSTTKNRSRSDTPVSASDTSEMQKIASSLFREEAKLVRRLSKIERHQIREAAKIEARHRKEAEKEDKARARDETEVLKREVEHLKKECERLKEERKQWLSLIKALQAENTKLARQGSAGVKDRDAK